MKRLTVVGMMLGIMLLMSVCAFGAGVPQVINYSGTLINKVGAAVPDGTYDIEFNIYNVPSAGTALWTEKWSATAIPASPVLVTGGVFNLMLGTIVPFPNEFFANNPNTYLGIKVGADSEMLPRQKIASVGYAFAAGNGVPKGGVIMWSGAVTAVPAGWALCNGANGTPDLRDRFIVGGGATYSVNATGGSATISLQHSHTVDSHNHGGLTGYVNGPDGASGRFGSGNAFNFAPYDAHRHYINAESPGTNTQLSSTQSILPPYYALAFIMKL